MTGLLLKSLRISSVIRWTSANLSELSKRLLNPNKLVVTNSYPGYSAPAPEVITPVAFAQK